MTRIRKSKGGVNERRKRVIERLEKQLKLNSKLLKSKLVPSEGRLYEPLTDTDRTRIEKELQTLKSRVS
jgi:hypothetical protein